MPQFAPPRVGNPDDLDDPAVMAVYRRIRHAESAAAAARRRWWIELGFAALTVGVLYGLISAASDALLGPTPAAIAVGVYAALAYAAGRRQERA